VRSLPLLFAGNPRCRAEPLKWGRRNENPYSLRPSLDGYSYKIIHTLYRLGFAEVTKRSPPTPTANSGEVMSIMTRLVLLD
jgi:hypothetical protein